jgi:hypothetical protein
MPFMGECILLISHLNFFLYFTSVINRLTNIGYCSTNNYQKHFCFWWSHIISLINFKGESMLPRGGIFPTGPSNSQLDLWEFPVWTGALALYNSYLPFFFRSAFFFEGPWKKSQQNLGSQSGIRPCLCQINSFIKNIKTSRKYTRIYQRKQN